MAVPYRERPAPPALARWVECLWSIDSPLAVADYPVAPDGCLDIVYSRDAGLRATGAMTSQRRFDLPAESRPLGVRFRPGMAARFLKAPPAELTDAVVALEDLWGKAGRALARRIEDLDSPAARLDALAAALPVPFASPGPVERALAALVEARGDVDLDSIACLANLSPRQFRRRCLEAAGLTPKHLCRVLRFRHAAQLAAAPRGLPWSMIALEAGYFDQAHLIRDFREFTGRPPRANPSPAPPTPSR